MFLMWNLQQLLWNLQGAWTNNLLTIRIRTVDTRLLETKILVTKHMEKIQQTENKL